MADNVVANAGSGGATFRAFSDGTNEWPACIPAYVTGGSAGTWTIQGVDSSHGLPVGDAGGSLTVDNAGTFAVQAAQSGTWNITNISGTVSLPTGAATAAKQPALGTAGTASTDVITVQGIASMTALKVDGSAVTQPVSDGGSTLSVDDGGGSLTVDGTVTATLSSSTNAGATAKTSDYDTGAGTDTVTMFGLALPASGGAVAGGTATNPLQVSLANTAANSTAVKVDGSGVTQPVSGTVTVQQSTASSLKVDLSGTAANATAIKVDGSAVTQPVSNAGTFAVQATQSGTWTMQPGNTANTTAWLMSATPVTSGGLSFKKVLSAASTNLTSVKASAGQIYGIYLGNTNAAARYLKLYNVASGSVTVGTTTPDLTFLIPGNTAGAGFVLPIPPGVAFGTAITYALTTGAADSDTGAVAANEIVGAILYK